MVCPASYMIYVKGVECEGNHSFPSCAEVKRMCSYTFTLNMSSWMMLKPGTVSVFAFDFSFQRKIELVLVMKYLDLWLCTFIYAFHTKSDLEAYELLLYAICFMNSICLRSCCIRTSDVTWRLDMKERSWWYSLVSCSSQHTHWPC
jgi:hypothetical protein